MSHDGPRDLMTRQQQREAREGRRRAAPRQVWKAGDFVRRVWSPEAVVRMLETRAPGYNGTLRSVLCTAAAMIRDAMDEDVLSEKAKSSAQRNQQPGRLSGGEREALKKFVATVIAAGSDEGLMSGAMGEGRALLTKVRKRALGGESDREALMVTELDAETIEAIAASEMPGDVQKEDEE